jgi:hypothetical protein
MSLNSLGGALYGIGRFDEVITAFQDAAAIFREAGDEHRERIALGNRETAEAARLARG